MRHKWLTVNRVMFSSDPDVRWGGATRAKSTQKRSNGLDNKQKITCSTAKAFALIWRRPILFDLPFALTPSVLLFVAICFEHTEKKTRAKMTKKRGNRGGEEHRRVHECWASLGWSVFADSTFPGCEATQRRSCHWLGQAIPPR